MKIYFLYSVYLIYQNVKLITFCPLIGSTPSLTVPKAPRPSNRITSYLPTNFLESKGELGSNMLSVEDWLFFISTAMLLPTKWIDDYGSFAVPKRDFSKAKFRARCQAEQLLPRSTTKNFWHREIFFRFSIILPYTGTMITS